MIYIGSDFKCHAESADGRTSVETDFFDGKCEEFVSGYRFIPAGQTWTREDGVEFVGEMIAPWTDYTALDAAQREYERQKMAEYEAALTEIENALGVTS